MPYPSGRIAGIDFGTVRIGIAITDPDGKIASPLENYTRRGQTHDAAHFRRLVIQEGVARFVVGLPVHLDGRESEKSVEARRFGQWLAEVTGMPVEFFDERFTSQEAEQVLRGAELTKKRRKKRLDMLAAQIMLAAYLESQGQAGDARAPWMIDDLSRKPCLRSRKLRFPLCQQYGPQFLPLISIFPPKGSILSVVLLVRDILSMRVVPDADRLSNRPSLPAPVCLLNGPFLCAQGGNL